MMLYVYVNSYECLEKFSESVSRNPCLLSFQFQPIKLPTFRLQCCSLDICGTGKVAKMRLPRITPVCTFFEKL